jgi:hypothetical protein
MAYAPGFDYDIFVSFSHRDNALRPGQDPARGGWVERFVGYLEWWLGERRGLAGLKVWLDKGRLTGSTEIDERIRNDLGRAALFLVIHSHNFQRSTPTRLIDPSTTSVLLLVDQFEELFRFAQGRGLGGTDPAARTEAEAFVALLLRLAEQDRVPVYCVLTMRSDFIGDCDAFGGLPEAINRGQFLVPRLSRAQRREAIVGPVRLTGERIAPRLVDLLLNERLDTRDDLPILQHLLLRCWDDWAAHGAQGPIDLETYERVHTIHQALDRHAQEALDELDPAERPLARRLFQTLTELDPGNRRIRRPARLSEAAVVAGACWT